jgi:hypothetical protein
LLYSICPEQKKLFIYNIDFDEWNTMHISLPANLQAAAVHDHKNNRFFWIGGIETVHGGRNNEGYVRPEDSYSFAYQEEKSYTQKSSKILVYEPSRKEHPWRYLEARLNVPRSSCQAVMVDKEDGINYGIVIAGGLGPNGEVLKSTEFLDLHYEECSMLADTNFGAFSGTLVTYNKTNVIRIGGLYKNKADLAVVEVVERLDLTEWLKTRQRLPRWSYVELLVPDFKRGTFSLFHAKQAAVQINPNEIFVFGGITSGNKGAADSYIISIEEFDVQSRGITLQGDLSRSNLSQSGNREERLVKQYKFTVRWPNEKPLISEDDFGGQCPSLWKGKLHILQNTSSEDLVNFQKRLLCFDMHVWS